MRKENDMNIVRTLIDKIDGNKTYAGLILYAVYYICVYNGIISENPSLLVSIQTLTGIGLVHKVEKIFN